MTVSSTSSRVVFLGDGQSTQWPFAFKVQQAADLVVVYTDLTGTDIVLSGADYAVDGLATDSSGRVTYPLAGAPIPPGTRLTIYRNVAVTQPTSISNQGAMWPSVIEAALDRLTYIAQRLNDAISRALVVSPTDDSVSLGVLPARALRRNAVLGFDANGQPAAIALESAGLVGWSTWLRNNLAPAASDAQACAILRAARLPDANTFLGNNSFTGTNTFTGANSFTGGSITVPTAAAGDNGPRAASTAYADRAATAALQAFAVRSYLAGLALANSATAPTTALDVAAGICADDGNAVMLSLPAGTIDLTAVGANGLDAGSLAGNAWYHAFAIARPGGAAVARLASASFAAPVLPAGYTLKRRLGSFRTDGSGHVQPFTQVGDEFIWANPVTDYNGQPGTTPFLQALSVPPGLKVKATIRAVGTIAGGLWSVLVTSPDEVPGASRGIVGNASLGNENGAIAAGTLAVWTDTSRQVRLVAENGGADLALATCGWVDRRGRDA
jgi:hypothetical protein